MDISRKTLVQCAICPIEFWAVKSKLDKGWSKYCSRKCRGISESGMKHHNWKGDKVGYVGLHSWVVKHFGKPDTCEHCGTAGLSGRKINWANKSHKYLRDLSDWLRLCVSCHKKYDPLSEETRGKISNILKGRIFSKETKIKMSKARKRYWHNKKSSRLV